MYLLLLNTPTTSQSPSLSFPQTNTCYWIEIYITGQNNWSIFGRGCIAAYLTLPLNIVLE